MRVTKDDITLVLDCWVDELSAAQLAAYERVANEHNAIKGALKTALNANEGRELFSGQVFQAYSFKGKVLQELRDATLPKKPPKPVEPPPAAVTPGVRGRKRGPSNLAYLESSDEGEDDVPLARRIAAAGKRTPTPSTTSATKTPKHKVVAAAATSSTGKSSQSPHVGSNKPGRPPKNGPAKAGGVSSTPPPNFKPSEISSVGGLVIGNADGKEGKESKDASKDAKLQGKTFPSLVVLAKPWLKVKDMSATRSKLDSKVKLVLMLTPNKFTEWLIQEGLLKSEQKCANHRNSELKLGVYSDATKFPYTGGYVWISECCPMRFVSVFHGSIFEGAPHPPSCILKLIYHWSCQTNIQNVVQWVKVDNVYIKGVYTWLRAVCTLAVHQKCKKLGGPDKFVEVGVISLGTTSQDGQQRQVKVEVLGVLDYEEKTIRLRAVEPVSDVDRNYKKRFQTILEPLQRWVHKDSTICIDLTVERMTLHSMGFKNVVQAAATDSTAKHTNSAVMDYLRRIVPRMFQNTLSLLSRQMIQQFLDELVWREQFGTYALQAFNNITTHIAEQTRMTVSETLTQRLYQVATNPFKDWSALPPNFKDTPANTTPKRLKKPINEADYVVERVASRHIKKEKETSRSNTPTSTSTSGGKRRNASAIDDDYRPSDSKKVPPKSTKIAIGATAPTVSKKIPLDPKVVVKDDDELRGVEELYYGVRDGYDDNFESFPYNVASGSSDSILPSATYVECPICDIDETFAGNVELQMHLVTHINEESGDDRYQCCYCLEKYVNSQLLQKHQQMRHPLETKSPMSTSYHCLICQLRFNSLQLLSGHLQKLHNMVELPYLCQACGYRSSSQRDVMRHYYEDHKNQNFLLCPFCLEMRRFSYKGQVNISNIENFYMHLRQHTSKKELQYRCPKCVLSFNDRGSLKQHATNLHVSLLKSVPAPRPLISNSLLIIPTRVRNHHREPLPFVMQQKFGDYFASMDGTFCAECNTEIINEEHFTGRMKCLKCNYRSCCERAVFEHAAGCTGTADDAGDVMELPLDSEMHCICGFATAIGNKMAQHLANCGHKSAYCSVEAAHENTVKRNMLDMLGLVRRDGDGAGSDAQPTDGAQEPIQFGEMDAAPIVVDPTCVAEPSTSDAEPRYSDDMDEDMAPAAPLLPPPSSSSSSAAQPQYTLSFGQSEVAGHALNAADIDMPLIGELADPNPPATPQFLGEVHTPMFDAVAAAEQQHYQQLLQQQGQPPQ